MQVNRSGTPFPRLIYNPLEVHFTPSSTNPALVPHQFIVLPFVEIHTLDPIDPMAHTVLS